MRDLIASEQVPVVRLQEVFRQAQTSAMITNAHRINQGQYPQLEPVSSQPKSDCLWFKLPQAAHGIEAIRTIIKELMPDLGFNPATDVQVLCPMTRGEVGTRNLNALLQQLINPAAATKSEIVRGGITLRVGDRVMQRQNDYDREVFNGDLGVVSEIDLEAQEVKVEVDQRSLVYDYADLDEISLAWAMTIHKSQGSEYPVVLLPMFMQHYPMLSRNLLYTGLTRAKKLAILVGEERAISLAVRQVKDQQRYTLLADRLMKAQVIS